MCVDNIPTVVLMAAPPLDDQGLSSVGALPTELRAAIEASLCGELPWCCERFHETLALPGNTPVQVATKYWLRRLLHDLSARGTFSVSLLGAPSRLSPVEPSCLLPTSIDACVAGAPELMRFSDWHAAAPEVLSNDQVRALLDASVRAVDGDPEALLSWVDGVLVQDASGHVTNPEFNTIQAGPYDLGLITWLYLMTDHRPEGRRCAADADCGHRHYRCVEGGCTDPAAACRTQDVVVLGSFLDRLQVGPIESQCYVGGVGGVDWDVWVRWLRWGVSCEAQSDCRVGSSCVAPCDFSEYPECELPQTCLPDAFVDPFGDILLHGAVADFASWAPTPFAADTAGRELTATFHAIFTGMDPGDPFYAAGGLEYATRAALLGGGIAVTPSVPEVMPIVRHWTLDSPSISFDYEAQYDQMIHALSARLGTTACTPELVGLGVDD